MIKQGFQALRRSLMSDNGEDSEVSDKSMVIIDAYSKTLFRPELLYRYLLEQGHYYISLQDVKDTL